MGIGLQHSKAEGPATSLIYLGIGIDTQKHELFLPEVKRAKYLNNLTTLLAQEESSMESIAKMAGQLLHISAIHRAGKGHVQPLWIVIYRDRKSWTKRQITAQILTVEENLKECLTWWKTMFKIFFIFILFLFFFYFYF